MTVPALDAHRIRRQVRSRLLDTGPRQELDALTTPQRRLRVREEVLSVLREARAILPAETLTEIVNQVSDEVVGLGPVERLLKDPEVSEVMVNGADDVYVERKGPIDILRVDKAEGGPMRAFGYVRISKLDGRTTSPARQREAIQRLCGARGWELVKVFEDLDVSGYQKAAKRPGLDRMLSRLDEADAIVFWKLDRLARGVQRFYGILQRCEAANVAVVSTAEPFDTSSPMGRAMVGITAVFAELESDIISERAKSMHAHLREQGRWVGRVPFGFRLSAGKLEPEPEQQSVLLSAAQRYVAGESLRTISADVGIAHPSLARMLKNDRTIDHLPPAVAGALVRNLAERGRDGTRAKQSLLGGIARCGVCGAGMTVTGQRMGNGARKAWGAYACRERGHVAISRGWLDQHVSEAVLQAIDTGELVKRIDRRNRPGRSLASSEIEARLELLDRDFYEKGIMPRDAFLRRREGILKRLKVARDQQEDAGIDLPRELAANLADRWPDLSLHGRRRIIGAVLERIDVRRASNHGKVDPSRVALVWRGSTGG